MATWDSVKPFSCDILKNISVFWSLIHLWSVVYYGSNTFYKAQHILGLGYACLWQNISLFCGSRNNVLVSWCFDPWWVGLPRPKQQSCWVWLSYRCWPAWHWHWWSSTHYSSVGLEHFLRSILPRNHSMRNSSYQRYGILVDMICCTCTGNCHWGHPFCLNPLRANFFRGNITIYLHFMSFIHIDMTQDLYSQYHGCWCPGNVRSQGISNHDIDLVKLR